MDEYEVNGLQLPNLFIGFLREGLWRHPGDETLRRLIPFLREPVDFLTVIEAMRRESTGFLATRCCESVSRGEGIEERRANLSTLA
jgi:hypothetical protein